MYFCGSIMKDQMSARERKELDEFLLKMTASHSGELRNEHMSASNAKLINNDKNTSGLTLITEDSAAIVSSFMTRVFGANPFITQ